MSIVKRQYDALEKGWGDSCKVNLWDTSLLEFFLKVNEHVSKGDLFDIAYFAKVSMRFFKALEKREGILINWPPVKR